jgi:hypothetical protein
MVDQQGNGTDMKPVSSGLRSLDELLQGLRYGDNVVFQVEQLPDYQYFTEPFLKTAVAEGRKCVYIRFAPHPPVVSGRSSLEVIEVDPGLGFDYFSRAVHRIVEESGRHTYYILDNLSTLVVEWATDELLANFFQATCPFMYEMECVTYFALNRNQHAHAAIARIRDTTQILVDVYHVDDRMYVHPLKVWDRYSPRMFLPHLVEGESWQAISESGRAAVSARASGSPFQPVASNLAPWDSVYEKLKVRTGTIDENEPEIAALKGELCRMMIGSNLDFASLVEKHLDLSVLLRIRGRMLGSGRIGGKATGMLLARRILLNRGSCEGVDFVDIMDEHDSFYIGSDVFFTFLVENDLFLLRLQMTSDSAISDEEFQEVERRFLEGRFSPPVMEQFRNLLDYFGQAPIIVRSSSLLEDSLGNSFAGKYRSEFCANQGSPEERLEFFTRAMKLVYASALNPDALAYRRNRGLGESDEQMAVLVQRVSGFPYRRYFFPPMAGVAFSRNLYAWSDRIDYRQGVIRLVMGLGTRAVDRVGSDYPRMIAISHPGLRPEDTSEVSRYSQHLMDLIDMEENRFATMPLTEVLEDHDYPGLHLLVSYQEEDYMSDPVGKYLPAEHDRLVLTFNNLISRTGIVKVFKAMLTCLEEEYGCPVDVEFTASTDSADRLRINLLQCRPLFQVGEVGAVAIPDDLEPEKVLFRSTRMINGGMIENIRYLLYIDPKKYSAVSDNQLRTRLGRVVGRLNEHPDVVKGKVVMIGPGRWGSSNIALGVNVRYADINNTSALVELAREEAGHVPEVSYGTHFFQDLVEADIVYVPVWPDEPRSSFNDEFFENAPNSLLNLLPGADEYTELVKVIDLPAASGGHRGVVVADPQSRQAVLYLGG